MRRRLTLLLPALAMTALAGLTMTGCNRSASNAAHPDAAAPRFLSLKFDDSNAREAPSEAAALLWTYHRRGLPMEVIGQTEAWYQVRDPAGDVAWIAAANLDTRRTVYVLGSTPATARTRPSAGAPASAYFAPGVVGALRDCAGGWRRIEAAGQSGWVASAALWAAADC